MKKHTNYLILLVISVIIFGCNESFPPDEELFYPDDDWAIISKDLALPEYPYIYSSSIQPSGSPFLFDRKATIGRVLFYDKSISADGTISCASCHKQELAFSDDLSFSKGVHGNLTTRNSYALGSFNSLNSEYYGELSSTPLFWDNRAKDVATQLRETLANPSEMGMELDDLVAVVESKPYYQSLFALAGTPEKDYKITSDNILDCFQSFVRTINSNGSKFDQTKGEVSRFIYSSEAHGFTPSEQNGKLLFSSNCNYCHRVEMAVTDDGKFLFRREMANNGLDKEYADKGAGARSEYLSEDEYDGMFKVPDLRNVALTGPYMHDGRFSTLDEVIDHYSEGINDHKNLSFPLKDELGDVKKLNFTAKEKTDLLNFLNTLTDPNIIVEDKWSDPFKK